MELYCARSLWGGYQYDSDWFSAADGLTESICWCGPDGPGLLRRDGHSWLRPLACCQLIFHILHHFPPACRTWFGHGPTSDQSSCQGEGQGSKVKDLGQCLAFIQRWQRSQYVLLRDEQIGRCWRLKMRHSWRSASLLLLTSVDCCLIHKITMTSSPAAHGRPDWGGTRPTC